MFIHVDLIRRTILRATKNQTTKTKQKIIIIIGITLEITNVYVDIRNHVYMYGLGKVNRTKRSIAIEYI